MLAIAERAGERGTDNEQIIWHKPVGRSVDGWFQPIACSDDGIVLHGPKRQVPTRLDISGQRWCPDCIKTP